jgi:diadenosine tetraphosphate (Ap4A) HIT family hydrolase
MPTCLDNLANHFLISDRIMSASCPFCHPDIKTNFLWENAAYSIIADQYPLCVGHILLISKTHHPSHMHAPIGQLNELEAAQVQARQFLRDHFGKVSFYENGNTIHQEVPHAHLHAVPFTVSIPADWLEQGLLQRAANWQAIWQECERAGHYTYFETDAGQFVLQNDDQYELLLNMLRHQLATQTGAEIDRSTGEMKRGSAEMVTRTIQCWQAWAQKE